MALYLGKDKIAGFSTDSRIGDTLPVGAIIDYDGTEVPANWELVENSESGAGTVFISMFDAEEEVYDKMFSAVEPFDDEVNGLNARLIKHVIYEYSEYGDLRYHHAMNSYGEFDDNGNMIAVTMNFYFINGNQEFIQEIRAYTDDNGNKTYEHGEGWMQYIREPADYLTSTDATIALSANQGRVLNEKIEEIKNQPELIEFLLSVENDSNHTYHRCVAEKGMTFEQWIASSYYDSSYDLSFDNNQLVSTNLWTYYSITDNYSATSYTLATDVIFPYGVYNGRSLCCFEAGTQVLISLDGETKNIEDIQAGDQIVSYDLTTGKFNLATVNKLIINNMVTDVAEIILENNDKVRMNAYHPILTTNGYHSLTNHEGFATLTIDDVIITRSGNFKVKEIIRYTQEPEEMYNLNINDENHNYIANNIVVHNASCR